MTREPKTENSGEGNAAPATPARRRTGEKFGWIGGWLGGFLWLLISSGIRLAQGRAVDGFTGLGLFLVAVGVIFFLAPWRHPAVRQWKLMLPVYLVFFASVAWMMWTSKDLEQWGMNRWSFFWILPCLIPLWTVGGRRWGEQGE